MAKEEAEKKKVKRPTALKRDLQSKKRRLRNKSYRAKVVTAVRSMDEALSTGKTDEAKLKFSEVCSLMDKGVKTGIFKQNKADRTKSRLSQRLV